MITLIVAMTKDGLIGNGNTLPWHLPDELKHFKETTTGNAVIMGRKTWDSIPSKYKPLSGRLNVVISRSRSEDECCCGAHFVGSLEEAIMKANALKPRAEFFIAGGKSIYELALQQKVVDRLLVSVINGKYDGDVYFPKVILDCPKYFGFNERRLVSSCDNFSVWEYLKNDKKTGM